MENQNNKSTLDEFSEIQTFTLQQCKNEINNILEFGYNNKGWLDFPEGLPKIKIDVQTDVKELSFSRSKNNILTITALTKNTDLKDICLNFARAKTLNKLNKVSHWNCYRYFPFI